MSQVGTHSCLRALHVERMLLHMEHTPSSEGLAAVIASAIKAAGMSHRSVALASGIAPTTFHRKIHATAGNSPFTYPELRGIAVALGQPLSALLAKAEQEAEEAERAARSMATAS